MSIEKVKNAIIFFVVRNRLTVLNRCILNKGTEIIMNIGEKIRNAREDLDMSQNDMAKLIPMNQSNYSKIERNLQEPSLEQFRRICQILRLDPRYLLNLESYEYMSPSDIELLSDVKLLLKKYGKNNSQI